MARILFLLADGFEDAEFTEPYRRLGEAGHDVVVAGKEPDVTVTGKRGDAEQRVEEKASDIDVDAFDALVIPGGYSPDRLRTDEGVVTVVRKMFENDRPVAAICHGGSLLVEADVARGRTVTSWPSIRTDLVNAGADWIDEPVVIDGMLITSRRPDDLDEFIAAIEKSLEA